MNNISLSYLVKLALKKLWFLLIAAVIFGVCTFCYCNFLTKPIYKASGSLLVTNGALISNSTNAFPMGLNELVSYKFIIRGDGQIR